MEPETDDAADKRRLLEDAAIWLVRNLEYPTAVAEAHVAEYVRRFQDRQYCASLGMDIDDDEMLHRDGRIGVALRAHYYIGLNGDPHPGRFEAWEQALWKAGGLPPPRIA